MTKAVIQVLSTLLLVKIDLVFNISCLTSYSTSYSKCSSLPHSSCHRTKKSSVASHRAGRPAKRKAMQCLTEKTSDEDDIISDSTHPQPTKKSKTARSVTSQAMLSLFIHFVIISCWPLVL